MNRFSDSGILPRLCRTTLTRFLEDHKQWLPPDALALLDAPLNYEQFCAAWTRQFQSCAGFGAPLIHALQSIETVAQPDNAKALAEALSRLPEGFTVNRNYPPLHQALHLYIIAQHYPEVPWPGPVPQPAGSADFQSAVSPISNRQPSTPPATPVSPPDASDPAERLGLRREAPLFVQTSVDQSTAAPQASSADFQSAVSPISPPSTPPAAPLSPTPAPDPAASVAQSLPEPPAQPKSKIENQNSKMDEATEPTDDPAIERLALLTPRDYDRLRKAEAKRLGIRVSTLDDLVDQCRGRLEDAEADKIIFDEIQPWPEPITDAPGLFDAIHGRFTAYAWLPPGAATVLSLFTGHCSAFAAFHYTPRINLRSDFENSGKSTTLKVIAALVPRPLPIHSLRPPTVYRMSDPMKRKLSRTPVLLFDEVENYLPLYRELLGLLNAGNSSDVCVPRCEGNKVRFYRPFAPVVLAGLGDLFRTLRSRSILIHMTEAPAHARLIRFDPAHLELEKELRRKLARWAPDNLEKIAACDPPLPPGLRNRRADNWRVLFQLAHVIGGHWPQLVLEAHAALHHPTSNAAVNRPIGDGLEQSKIEPSTLNPQPSTTEPTGASVAQSTGSADFQSAVSPISSPSTPSAAAPVSPPDASDPALSVQTSVNQSSGEQSKLANQNSKIAGHPSSPLTQQLLTDIRQVFEQTGANRLFSRDLLARLIALPGQPWSYLLCGKPLTARWLAVQLRPFGIRTRTLALNDTLAKGYLREDFVTNQSAQTSHPYA